MNPITLSAYVSTDDEVVATLAPLADDPGSVELCVAVQDPDGCHGATLAMCHLREAEHDEVIAALTEHLAWVGTVDLLERLGPILHLAGHCDDGIDVAELARYRSAQSKA